jgi:TolB-like protein/Tfp pilus assembly protein PilF
MVTPTKAVFLSYASQDAEAARRMCESLRAAGVEVWFDAAGGLEHGDEWDAKIRRQIKECALFIPLISANTQARHEGYFRMEWDAAAERARGIAAGVPFILPVVIDDTGEPAALVPDRFRAVQWTRLPDGVVPADVLARFLQLWTGRAGAAPAAAAPSAVTRHPLAAAKPAADDKSIAVLPFANMSADAENEYFSDGMTEEIINALVQVPDLRVAARTSVFAFKGKADDLRLIADRLNVRTVLEGSVRKAGNRIRITAQLINAADGFHLWSEKFDRGLDDIFSVQDEIAHAIVEKLKVKLSGGAGVPLVAPATEDLEAYQLYLRGRYYWEQRGPGLLKALECFEAALARDPDYALAHTGVADVCSLLAFYGHAKATDVADKARRSAERALALNPQLAEAHCALGWIIFSFERNLPLALQRFRRAIELKPSYVPALYWMAGALQVVGRYDEIIALDREAVRLEPFSVVVNSHLGWMLLNAGRHEEAVRQLERTLDLDPRRLLPHWLLGQALIGVGRNEEGLASLHRAVEISAHDPFMLASWGCALAYLGRKDEARAVLAELTERAGTRYVKSYFFALVHAYLGDEDLVLSYLEKALEEGEALLPYLSMRVLPSFSGSGIPIRYLSTVRAEAFIRKLGTVLE